MGLTASSTGMMALDSRLEIKRRAEDDRVVAIAGNPNVGKSTVFNGLTGLHQHTGNWPGKTVTNAQGHVKSGERGYVLVDIPGAYSLMAHSAEEEVARNFICFGQPDAVVVVCDASCLQRNLNLALQTMEAVGRVLICVNLMDEAEKKGIRVNLEELSRLTGVPVVGTVARKKKTLRALLNALDHLMAEEPPSPRKISYSQPVEDALAVMLPAVAGRCGEEHARWLSLKLLDGDPSLLHEIEAQLGLDVARDEELQAALTAAQHILHEAGLDSDSLKDTVVSAIVHEAERLSDAVVVKAGQGYSPLDRRLDKLLTGKLVGYPVMLLMLCGVFWLTITGANLPSAALAEGLFWLQERLSGLLMALGTPLWLHDMLVLGVYRVLASVVSVMLPPMAIFFPLFTLLEDAGYLPRVAYNLDKSFKRCHACGKQALCMCMGFGCNAAGVVGCRIIDSPRERLIAILTNSFVPCNGRFPGLIMIISLFFVFSAGGAGASVISALILTLVIVLGIGLTLGASWLLSKTVLKGLPSSFALELPSYRRPQIGKVLVRSIFDRTLFVLGRAVAVAAPAGLLIWLMANVRINELSLLAHCAGFLDPFARFFGLDGVILLAFILGFPANEIVVPVMLMAYMAQGSLMEIGSIGEIKRIFVANGWTWVTALCVMLFSLAHWPCSTTIMTIYSETRSKKWTLLAFMLPTVAGFALCFLAARLGGLF